MKTKFENNITVTGRIIADAKVNNSDKCTVAHTALSVEEKDFRGNEIKRIFGITQFLDPGMSAKDFPLLTKDKVVTVKGDFSLSSYNGNAEINIKVESIKEVTSEEG